MHSWQQFVLFVALLNACVAGACSDIDSAPQALELGDSGRFAADVQPYIGVGCGSLACHGDPGRAFRIYAIWGLRLDAELREMPVTDVEISRNLLSIAALAPADIEVQEHLLLRKGLATYEGGFAHEGGDIWKSTDDDGYQCLLRWLSGSPQTQAVCQRATDAENPPAL